MAPTLFIAAEAFDFLGKHYEPGDSVASVECNDPNLEVGGLCALIGNGRAITDPGEVAGEPTPEPEEPTEEADESDEAEKNTSDTPENNEAAEDADAVKSEDDESEADTPEGTATEAPAPDPAKVTGRQSKKKAAGRRSRTRS